MSHFTASITAFDIWEGVHVTLSARDHDLAPDDPDHEFYVCYALTGRGYSDPRKWLRQVLMDAAEEL